MKKNILATFLLALVLSMMVPMTSKAFPAPGPGSPKPSPQPSDPSPGGGGDEGESGEGDGGESSGDGDETPEEPQLLTYTPVVTALHSVNAAFIDADTAVYFLPALEDFPVDLTATCADLTTDDGKQHKFAVVYDGYFDTEVKYFQATAGNGDTTRLQTSKKVFSSTDNSRCLNLLGYDLLLADETCNITSGDGVLNFDYVPTIVGKNKLTAKTCIMDLYKAVGAYEWDIKVTYGKDISDLDVNTSPIMQDIVVLTNDERPGGIDTEEGSTWVWASRTNPSQYWARCKKDAIFDGGAHKYTKENYIGNKTSCTFSKNETEYVTMAEFCVMARAIMELYGEPVITPDQINNMIQLYALELPSADYDEEQREAIEYLAAKGVIDPAEIEFDKHVTFQDIEEILLRIADEDSRIIVQSQANFANALVQAGFVETTLSDNLTAAESFEEISNPYDDNMFDYVVEAVDGYTNFYVRTINATDYLTPEGLAESVIDPTATASTTRSAMNGSSSVYGLNVSMLTGAEVSDDFLFACDSIRVRTPGGDVGTTPGSGYFDFLGLEEYDDKQYYHFRIDKDLPSIEIYYDTGTTNAGSPTDAEGTHIVKELQGLTSYTLTPGGGVYNFSNGTEERITFDDANFSYSYIDATRVNEDVYNLAETEAYLSTYTWILMSWNKGDFTQSNLKGIQYTSPANKNDPVFFSDFAIEQVDKAYTYDFADGKHTFFTKGLSSATGGTDKDKVYVLAQVPVDYNTFNSRMQWNGNSNSKVSESKAYYRYDDDTLLVPFSYLKSTGLCSSMTFPDNDTLILTLSKYANTNVTLNNKYKLIVVGDTIMKDDSSVMFYKDPDNEVYINFRACLGWGNQYVVVNSAEGSLPVLNNSDIIGTKYKMAISCKAVKNYYPDNSFNVSWGSQKVTVSNGYQPSGTTAGFTLTGTNPFGNYILFENEADQDNDVLFMVKRDGVVSPSGAKVSGAATDAARSEFKNLTGVSIDIPSGFSMYYAYLSKNGTGNFKNIHYTYKTKYSSGKVDLGYVYIPKSYSSVNDAINEYVADTSGTILPLAMVNNSYINLNMNTCKDSAGGEQLAMGTMPYALAISSKSYKGNCFGVINKQGKVEENTSATYDSLANCVILAAPVGMFSGIKGFKPMPYQNISNKLFYGNEPAKFTNGALMVNNIVKVKPDTNVANCVYLTSAAGGLYVICSDSTMLVTDGEVDEESPEVIITEPETLVDWGAYKFGRLVEDLDSWSSIALIFILNILPRVAMTLFFVLMLLSLIKNVRPWRMFCQNVFDIYSFLTFGRQNVDTIDMKKMFIVSLICFSLFLMIMDGLLFEVIIWFCRFFIALWQH